MASFLTNALSGDEWHRKRVGMVEERLAFAARIKLQTPPW
jgi:hypothetical protein